ncbi:high frequency lysogenization protein HflD [Saccharophagus degradans]|uniref:high frequency lysogenization protein HflD n=1 Tax=Saccharophagus degradans TaxID=86304 RepID=UPI0024780337|nr:high frequency lysogenization protein HflD [Saccharophagus degradans]WGO96829.1 high frequency lysogenization protein HflD [Saccharophagus degradans]
MSKSWRELTIAFAGIVLATKQVAQLAKTGYLKTDEFETSVRSLFERNPVSTEATYGSGHNLAEAFEELEKLLNNHRDPRNADLLRYVLGVLHLQKKLIKRKEMLYVIGNRLEKAETQAQHFGITHDNVISNIAEIYTDTLSKFPYRIQVTGEATYLQQTRVASQIRVLLLAAIRSATLWRQLGGSRWQLLLYRNQMAKHAHELYLEFKR